ncbi:hypothetical protein P7K49_032385 [Saguinus oedipus]|uniref:Solute carrier family 19 member 1 n=1 Tax=Saguinus oedipus TaxID=9490 RepID=A0ABQ9TY39_SAGOE|nr:hypothetical protein P7K49_032385 [Saguinus oedipus]
MAPRSLRCLGVGVPQMLGGPLPLSLFFQTLQEFSGLALMRSLPSQAGSVPTAATAPAKPAESICCLPGGESGAVPTELVLQETAPLPHAQPQVTNEITPVLPYSYLAVLVPVFLLTDYLRYTPVLLLQGLSYVAVWLLLLLGRSVAHMQLMELFYSVTMAARIAFSSYIFSLVQPARYQRVAGYSRAAVLLGVFTSSVLGQLLVTAGGVSFSTLNYISLAFLTFSVVLALFLKRPQRSLFFNRGAAGREPSASASELERMSPGAGGKLGRALRAACGDSVLARVLRELGNSLRRPQLRLWSLWWVFNSAGYYLVVYYVHILWNEVDPTSNSARVYNGGADAASTLLGAITSFAAGFVKIRWAQWSKLLIAGVTATQAGLVFLLSQTRHIWLCYAAFVLFRGSYQFLVPIATRFPGTPTSCRAPAAVTPWAPPATRH